MNNKAKLVQLIHIAKSQLNLDDFTYREMLKNLTNKTSSTKCTVLELHKVLHHLQEKGAKVKWFAKRAKKPTAYSPATGEQKVKSEIVHKIRAVWIQMGKHGFLNDPSEKALNAYMRKIITNRSTVPLNVSVLDNAEAKKLLEILKQWHKRLMLKVIRQMRGEVQFKRETYEQVSECFDEVMKRC